VNDIINVRNGWQIAMVAKEIGFNEVQFLKQIHVINLVVTWKGFSTIDLLSNVKML